MTVATDLEGIRQEALACFPYEQSRPGQIEAIAQAVHKFRSGKKHVILDAPTGQGKSVMAIVVARMMGSSYYLTSSKILQSQISSEFGREGTINQMYSDLKGRNAYPCTFYDVHGPDLLRQEKVKAPRLLELQQVKRDCGPTSHCRKQLGRGRCSQCFFPDRLDHNAQQKWREKFGMGDTTCPYYERVFEAAASSHVSMNYHSFLYQTTYTENFMMPRNLMILDEAHGAFKSVLDFIQVNMTQAIFGNIAIPRFGSHIEYAEWAIENDIIGKLTIMAATAHEQRKIDEVERLTETAGRLQVFIDSATNGNEWVMVIEDHPDIRGQLAAVRLKPVMAADFSDRLFFNKANHFLHMSATILSPKLFAKNLGIEDYHYIKMGCDFPVENRPIFLMPAYKASGGKANQGEWEPKLIKAVDAIMERHAGDRGIIHTHNFSISKAILEKSKYRNRITYQHNFNSKEEMLEAHANKHASVIVAPAMHEGLDLKDDLARFQIIAKCPYPNPYDDEQLRKLIEAYDGMWDYMTALKLIQGIGRGVRHNKDWAKTYVLDRVACDFLTGKGKAFVPNWISSAIRKVG